MADQKKELSKQVTIVNELGLHARAAAKIARIAENGKAKLWIVKDGEKVDASSVIDILTLACARGTQITILADSESDIPVLNAVKELVESGFGEQ
jgi:phosphocarrier protein